MQRKIQNRPSEQGSFDKKLVWVAFSIVKVLRWRHLKRDDAMHMTCVPISLDPHQSQKDCLERTAAWYCLDY